MFSNTQRIEETAPSCLSAMPHHMPLILDAYHDPCACSGEVQPAPLGGHACYAYTCLHLDCLPLLTVWPWSCLHLAHPLLLLAPDSATERHLLPALAFDLTRIRQSPAAERQLLPAPAFDPACTWLTPCCCLYPNAIEREVTESR